MAKKALVVLAKGFEEVEAITPIDILRRAGVEVTVAGVGSDKVEAAHGVAFCADVVLEEFDGAADAVILPGGMPGAENLKKSTELKSRMIRMASEGKLIAAICASPAIVLAPWGLLNGKKATCYPGFEKSFPSEVSYSSEAVVSDGNVITSKGPGTAFAFGLKITEMLVGKAQAELLAEQMVYKA
ncbi:MAG: DJ-1 family protein [Candidatus Omnitrophica bacterium]|nr:DJ-1 family protein [Candidatus Omnitrophota bacterium]